MIHTLRVHSFFLYYFVHHPDLHSFPTRRSSDLWKTERQRHVRESRNVGSGFCEDCRSRDWVLRSEEHTSELQSRQYLVCRLLLEKKKTKNCHNIRRSFSTQRSGPPSFTVYTRSQ